MNKTSEPTYTPLTDAHVKELTDIVGKANLIYDDPERLQAFSHDEAAHCQSVMPEAVVRPANAQEISEILRFANRHHIAVTARGAGSGLSGGAVPLYRGIVLDCSRMSRIIEIDRENMTITVERGDHFRIMKCTPIGLLCRLSDESRDLHDCRHVAENAGGGKAV